MKTLLMTSHHSHTPWHFRYDVAKAEKSESSKSEMCFGENLFGTQNQISTLRQNLDKWKIKQTDVLASKQQGQSASVLSSEVKGELLAAIKRLKERNFIYGFFYGCKSSLFGIFIRWDFFWAHLLSSLFVFHLINFIIVKNQSTKDLSHPSKNLAKDEALCV